MTNEIKLRYTDLGLGINFYDSKEEQNFKAIIETIQPLVKDEVSLSASEVEWDLDNMKLGHVDPEANDLLNKITLKLVA